MQHMHLFAGLAWNPGIRGILVVLVGVVVLCGSVYLLLGTNLGARLGLLVALTGLFGWLVILTLIWWLTPPAIGPRGNPASWKPVEVYINGGGDAAKTEPLERLVAPSSLPSSSRILAANPQLAEEYPNGFTLSDLKGSHADIVEQYLPADSLDGWKLVSTANAGEAQTAADAALVASGLFQTNGEYKKLDVWQFGGKPTLADDCPDGGSLCRAWHRVSSAFEIKNPPHFAVVQVQRVVPQATVPGQAPPIPKVDPAQPVISVVLIRDIGNERVIPFLYFVISLSLFVLFAWALHSRDKTLMKNRELAASKGD
ncbi:MAG: hypothetical protein FGM58_05060 [Acidimicrobiia bacterium]|nr:hypothetical protein [Acidimicrobiia bacterium]